MDDIYVARFWSKIDKNGPAPAHRPELGPCWLWTAGKTAGGYGSFRFHKVHTKVHRLAWELTNGAIPDGMMVLHACDVRLCVRHLFLGDHETNMADMVAKGRQATGDRCCMRKYPEKRPRGERDGHARFTASEILEMRAAYAAGESQGSIGRRYGTGQGTIGPIVRRLTWRHLE